MNYYKALRVLLRQYIKSARGESQAVRLLIEADLAIRNLSRELQESQDACATLRRRLSHNGQAEEARSTQANQATH